MTASSSLDSADWQLLTHTDEIELSSGSVLRFDIDNTRGPQSSGGISLAKDLQLEHGYSQTLTFLPFQNNCCTLVVKPGNSTAEVASGQLVVSKIVHTGECDILLREMHPRHSEL